MPKNSKVWRGIVVPISLEGLNSMPRVAANASIRVMVVRIVSKSGVTIRISSI